MLTRLIWPLCWRSYSRRRPLALHADASARLPRRVLRCRQLLHTIARKLQRVLQPTTSLDSVDPGEHRWSHFVLEENDPPQRKLVNCLHRLPVSATGDCPVRPGHHLTDDGRRYAAGTHQFRFCRQSISDCHNMFSERSSRGRLRCPVFLRQDRYSDIDCFLHCLLLLLSLSSVLRMSKAKNTKLKPLKWRSVLFVG